ncbi:Transposase [Rhizobiales bacterium GAS113]|nr:Transposase [Rhizobiales bacterium GAS113]
MGQKSIRLGLGDLRLISVSRSSTGWVIGAQGQDRAACPRCRTLSHSRHSFYRRRVRDLPIQGVPVLIDLKVSRWRCRNVGCEGKIFVERLPRVASAHARKSERLAEIVRLLGHAAGGRPAERLASRLGLVASRDTVLRHLKRSVSWSGGDSQLRVVGIDDWAWRKGHSYGTIVVDLERRNVVDVLPDRSAASIEAWLRNHPRIEFIARDRDGLYADGAKRGAPQAGQIADRFHIVQNLRVSIERQLSRLERPIRGAMPVASSGQDSSRDDEQRSEKPARQIRLAGRDVQQRLFHKVRSMYEDGGTASAIALELGLHRRIVGKWIRLEALPERNRMTPKDSTPSRFHIFLERRWAEGFRNVRGLLREVQVLGYTGCYSRLAAFLSAWRRPAKVENPSSEIPATFGVMPCDPDSGSAISPIVAAALCLQPRRLLTRRQLAKVEVLKEASPDFVRMRALAMQFRGVLRGGRADKLEDWIRDAKSSGVYAVNRR